MLQKAARPLLNTATTALISRAAVVFYFHHIIIYCYVVIADDIVSFAFKMAVFQRGETFGIWFSESGASLFCHLAK